MQDIWKGGGGEGWGRGREGEGTGKGGGREGEGRGKGGKREGEGRGREGRCAFGSLACFWYCTAAVIKGGGGWVGVEVCIRELRLPAGVTL
eukprot:356327-Chlamydomonas_euryale.AAC.1